MYNKQNNLIFVHIPKTAGTAVSEYMVKLAGGKKDIGYHVEMDPDFLAPVRLSDEHHITLPMYRKLLSEKEYDSAIKFVVVRNPMSKLRSWYFFHIQNKWIDFSIEQMLPILVHDLKLIENRGYALNYNNRADGSAVFNTFGIMRQTDYFDIVSDNVNILKYESLQKDFDIFTEKYNLPSFEIPVVNTTKNIDLSNEEFYSKLTSGHQRSIIDYMLNYYQPDFNLLGYYNLFKEIND